LTESCFIKPLNDINIRHIWRMNSKLQ